MDSPSDKGRQRDTASLRVLAIFFAVLGSIVVFATVYELEQPRAALVNVISGLSLLLVSGGMWFASRRLQR